MIYSIPDSVFIKNIVTAVLIIIFLLIYKNFRIHSWRRILKESIEYHKLHLFSLNKDSSLKQNSRELAQSLLWGITKQLPLDLKDGKGARALLNSFSGNKTSLNTCGTVFYECAKNHKSTDITICRLNNTLISTLYRIFIIESSFSIIGLIYFDFKLFTSFLIKTRSNTGSFFLEMKRRSLIKK